MNMNKYMLMVLGELKNDEYFYKLNCLLSYDVPKEGEIFSNESAGRVTAVLDLHKKGAIKIYNKGEERIHTTMTYEFKILIIQPAFDGVYQKLVKDITGKTVEDYENQIQTKKNMPALLRKLNQFIAINKIVGKQAHFLQLLNDFESKNIEYLILQIKTKDIKSLKRDVTRRIRESGFDIKPIRSDSSFKRGAYQLTYPTSN